MFFFQKKNVHFNNYSTLTLVYKLLNYIISFIYLPSKYCGGSNLKNGVPRLPQLVCRILLHLPVGFLYLLGGHVIVLFSLQDIFSNKSVCLSIVSALATVSLKSFGRCLM